ncbi:PREDICTED: protein deglycase DJ-1-like [Trachymyrmex septentrionalis]|uniref:protein deglycase DJ-1-like n=1 Tax=Trachymyrmex septentrionalis TaxID=34720 RepID=UPI00084EE5C4|nr:PREDICTED: protein deglycase DJ-1-like [Trachymyrmex septentrionalis]
MANVKNEVKTALVLVADGTEEMEAVITIDVLRRAGITVTAAGVQDSNCVKCSRDVKICTDVLFRDAQEKSYDVVVLPGGLGGAKTFTSSKEIGRLLQKQDKENKLIAAICAAPTALKAHNIGKGKRITSYPSMKRDLCDYYDYQDDKNVVIDGNLITSRGPGTAFDFGLTIVEILINLKEATDVANKLLYKYESCINAA